MGGPGYRSRSSPSAGRLAVELGLREPDPHRRKEQSLVWSHEDPAEEHRQPDARRRPGNAREFLSLPGQRAAKVHCLAANPFQIVPRARSLRKTEAGRQVMPADRSKSLRISHVGLRGVVGPALTVAHALDFASAFGTFLEPGGAVIIGRDPRASGIMLREAVVAGLLACGRQV